MSPLNILERYRDVEESFDLNLACFYLKGLLEELAQLLAYSSTG